MVARGLELYRKQLEEQKADLPAKVWLGSEIFQVNLLIAWFDRQEEMDG